MDVRHRKAYMRIKLAGVKEAVLVNQGMSLVECLSRLGREFLNAPNRYEGMTVEFAFEPMDQHLTESEKFTKEIMAGLDLTDLVTTSSEDEALWLSNPINPKGLNYDPLYAEWQQCHITTHRERKTPQDLALLRKHVETHYSGSRWFLGHKW